MDVQAMADKEGAKMTIEPGDYRFYVEKERKAKYDLDQIELTSRRLPYSSLRAVIGSTRVARRAGR